MTNRHADLHLHTHYSDGSDSPARVVERAVAAGLSAIAITDHDTLAGVEEGEAAAHAAGLEFLRGVELSALHGKHEVHILGFGIRLDDAELNAALDKLSRGRLERSQKIVERLNALGIPITLDAVSAHTGPGGAIGRLHIAREMHATGHVKTVQDAFNRFIGAGKRAYVPKMRLSCGRAVELIHGASGLAFLAHPGIGTTHAILPRLLTFPFDGIEVYHSKHTPGQSDAYRQLAEEHGLLVTGGSDCHGEIRGQAEMGKVRLEWEWYTGIVKSIGAA